MDALINVSGLRDVTKVHLSAVLETDTLTINIWTWDWPYLNLHVKVINNNNIGFGYLFSNRLPSSRSPSDHDSNRFSHIWMDITF